MTRGPAAFRRPIDVLASGRLAVTLLAVLVLLLLVSLFVPRLAAVRSSGWLYGTCALIGLNLLVCMARRFRATLLLCRFPTTPPAALPFPAHRRVPAGGIALDDVARFLGGRGYRTVAGGDAVYGLRGRYAAIGHWIFHVSLLFLIAAGGFDAAGPPPFRGTMALGEGEAFDLQRARFLSTNAPPSPGAADLRFSLDGVEIATDGEEVSRLEARLSTTGAGPAGIGINRPFRRPPYQVMIHGFGYMPGWVIVEPGGRMLAGAWVKLLPFPLEGEDDFPIGPRTSDVRVRFYPDHRAVEGGDRDGGRGPVNPRFRARVRLLGATIFEGLLAPGQRVPLGDGREFFFLDDIRVYLLMDVIQEGGHRPIFAAMGIMILGLAWRYARIRKEILVRAGGDRFEIFGRSEMLEALFEEELDRLTAELARLPARPAAAAAWRNA